MKKIMSALAALMVLVGAFLFTGCEDLANEMPIYDNWYKYSYVYENDKGVVQFDCYLNYQRDGISVSKTDKKNLKVEFVDGLNVVLWPSGDSDNAALAAIAEGVTHNSYFMKTYAEGDDFGGTPMSKSKWLTIVELLRTKGDDFDEEASLPQCLTMRAYEQFDLNDEGMWKKILVNALLGQTGLLD